MTRMTLTARIMAVFALFVAAAVGAYGLQMRQIEREIADLPLVHLDPVVIICDRAQSVTTDGTQIAKNPVATSLR